MPYSSNEDLPASVKNNLPQRAQTIYRKAFNQAYLQYKDPSKRKTKESLDAVSAKVAWTAVKKEFKKVGDVWKPK